LRSVFDIRMPNQLMRRMIPMAPACCLLISAFFVVSLSSNAQTMVSAKQMREDAAGFHEFSEQVQKYVALHDSVEASLQQVKRADSPENIITHQKALADGIRNARVHAHRGEVFKHRASEAIRHAIRSVFQSAQSVPARATIRDGSPIKPRHLEANQLFPEQVPNSSVPPTLLLKLPHLPDELAYRIVGGDLVLVDVPAGLVVDSLNNVIPYTE
jgi:hypothetical protein